MNLSVLLIFAAFIAQNFSSPIEYGSVVDSISNYPFVVHLLVTSQHVKTKKFVDSGCGGVLLKPEIVLTAGHCMYEEKRIITEIEITAGSVYRRDDDDSRIETRFAAGFRIHKKFELSERNIFTENHYLPYDVAMIWLRAPFPVNSNPKIQTMNFIISDIKPNTIGDAVGWGQQENGLASRVLKKTELKTISNEECKRRYKYKNGPNTFCAISPDRKCGISCGDSGGPFIYQGSVVGLISYGGVKITRDENGKRRSSCDMRKPVVLADIRTHKEWMQLNLEEGAPTKKCKKAKQKYCAL